MSVRRKAVPLAKRAVRTLYGVQSSVLSDAFDATSGVDAGQSFIGLKASTAPVSLIRFGGKWSKRSAGATAQILSGQRVTYTSAFIATMPGGGRHIFARAPGAGGKRAPRLPLRRLHGPSAYQMVQGKDGRTAEQVTDELAAFAGVEILRQITLIRRR